ncbi:MAG: hypothetical protein Q4A04_07570 [Eubacteriales bacterium]|nr:hypothetical protein [Eubacteriales bacterium]
MSEEKLNELKEKVAGLQEELKELTPEELEQVTGGRFCGPIGEIVVAKLSADEALQVKAEGVQIITTSGQPGSGVSICVR